MLDTDARYDLVLSCQLKKPLVEDVVFEFIDKLWNVPHHCQNIEFISFYGVVGQKDIMKVQIEEMVAHNSHHLVSLHVMHVENVEVVKTAVERLTDLEFQIYDSIEHPDLLKLNHSHQIRQLSCPRVYSL